MSDLDEALRLARSLPAVNVNAWVDPDALLLARALIAVAAENERLRAALTIDELSLLGGARDQMREQADYWHGKECALSMRDAEKVLTKLYNANGGDARLKRGES